MARTGTRARGGPSGAAPSQAGPSGAIGPRGGTPATPATSATRVTGATAAAPAGDPFEALGDPNRRAIVELLASGGQDGRSVGELAGALPISRPAVSRHLRLLKRAGLVVEEPRGTRRIYRLHDAGPDAVRAYLEQVWGDAAARFRLVAENRADRSRTAR